MQLVVLQEPTAAEVVALCVQVSVDILHWVILVSNGRQPVLCHPIVILLNRLLTATFCGVNRRLYWGSNARFLVGNAGHQGKLSVGVVMLVSVQLGPVEVLLDTAHVAVGLQLIFGGNLGFEVLLVLGLLIAPKF